MPLIIDTGPIGPDSLFVEDDGIPGNARGQLRGNFGVFPFNYPSDSLTVQAIAGQSFTLNLVDPLGPCTFTLGT